MFNITDSDISAALNKARKLRITSAELRNLSTSIVVSYVDARKHATATEVAQYIKELSDSQLGGTPYADMALEAYTTLRKEGQTPADAVELITETVIDAGKARAEAGYEYGVVLA
jgi:hypothetical protein